MRVAITLLTSVILAGAPGAGFAFEAGARGTPADYAKRPLTLGEGQLRGDFAPVDFGLLFGGIGGRSVTQDIPGLRAGRVDTFGPGGGDHTTLSLTLGGGYGITDDIEAGVILLPILLAPDADFGDLELYGRYRFLRGDVEIGAQVTVAIPTNSTFGIGLGVPVLFHLGKVRIDTGIELEVIFEDPTAVDLDLPVAVSVDIQDGFFAGIRSGMYLPDLDEAAIPLYGHVGYTLVGGNAPFVDLVATFGWPRFIWTGPGNAIELDTFDLILGARFFFTVK